MAVKEYTNKAGKSCPCIISPMSRMRPDSAFGLTFPGRVKLTQIKSRLTEGVNFKEARLNCISSGAGCLSKMKMLPSEGAGNAFRGTECATLIKALLRLSMSAQKVKEMRLIKSYVRTSFPACPYPRSPGGDLPHAHGLCSGPSKPTLGGTRAELGAMPLVRAGCSRTGVGGGAGEAAGGGHPAPPTLRSPPFPSG